MEDTHVRRTACTTQHKTQTLACQFRVFIHFQSDLQSGLSVRVWVKGRPLDRSRRLGEGRPPRPPPPPPPSITVGSRKVAARPPMRGNATYARTHFLSARHRGRRGGRGVICVSHQIAPFSDHHQVDMFIPRGTHQGDPQW